MVKMVKTMVEMVKTSELVLDFTFYPRHRIEPYNVAQMVQVLEAKKQLPPIRADRQSKRVTDGFHRVRAYQKFAGANAEIPTEFKDYKNEREMFLDAVRLNAQHGRQLSIYDRARCITLAESFHIQPKVIATVLNITLNRMESIKSDRVATFGAEPVSLKRTTEHLSGRELTEAERAYNIKAGGMPQSFYVNQVLAMLEADAVDWENEKLVAGLKRLHELLEKALSVATA